MRETYVWEFWLEQGIWKFIRNFFSIVIATEPEWEDNEPRYYRFVLFFGLRYFTKDLQFTRKETEIMWHLRFEWTGRELTEEEIIYAYCNQSLPFAFLPYYRDWRLL